MTYTNDCNPYDPMESFFYHMGNARKGGPNVSRDFDHAVICLVDLYDRIMESNQDESERLRQFRRESSEALMSFKNHLAAYPAITLNHAEAAGEDEWNKLCLRRSAIQTLIDDYAGTPIAALIDPAEVAELDEEMRRVGNEYGPVPNPFVPKGIPESHWWWSYPSLEREHGQE